MGMAVESLPENRAFGQRLGLPWGTVAAWHRLWYGFNTCTSTRAVDGQGSREPGPPELQVTRIHVVDLAARADVRRDALPRGRDELVEQVAVVRELDIDLGEDRTPVAAEPLPERVKPDSLQLDRVLAFLGAPVDEDERWTSHPRPPFCAAWRSSDIPSASKVVQSAGTRLRPARPTGSSSWTPRGRR
jgi:hypothetical protein